MRILLTATASYAPPRGGATRSNLLWLDHLAHAGHECRIVCGASGPGAELRHHEAIVVMAAEDPARRIQLLRQHIKEFEPDWVLVSSEDLAHGLLREAHHCAPGRVVYLAHTPQFYPFGAASWNPERHAAELVAQSAGIVAIGRHMAEYIERELGRPAAVIHPPIYGRGPYPNLARFHHGFLTMLNPCAVKGISIFLEAAQRLPAHDFAVVLGWGTTAEDRRHLLNTGNMKILPNARNIEDILARTRILLMPSLWYEGFGLIVMEAMLRGIPVVSSDAGGLKEAKRGTGYVIPVRTIEKYQPVFDEHAMPKPVVPPNDVGPWVEAIEELLGSREAYERESARSKAVAEQFVSGLDAAEMERYLLGLKPAASGTADRVTIESLSPEKRALLLQRLHVRKKGAGDSGASRRSGLDGDSRPGSDGSGSRGGSRRD
jgi:glycosyltransferase involved in cell wall biosynthesis